MPDDQLSKVEARKALSKVSMKPKEDPTVLIERLRMIEASYMESTMVIIDEAHMIAVVMDKTPAEYKSIIITEMKREGGGTLDDLEELLHQQWRALYGTKDDKAVKNSEDDDDDDDANDEVVLFAGTCFKCNKKGHRAADFQSGEQDMEVQKGSFKGSCFKCGKNGHRATDCWDDEKNASKRPKNWKHSTAHETGAAAVDNDKRIEYILHTIETERIFPTIVAALLGSERIEIPCEEVGESSPGNYEDVDDIGSEGESVVGGQYGSGSEPMFT
jgi:Zinc knuckle